MWPIRDILALPVRLVGLGIANPSSDANLDYTSSVKVKAPLVEQIVAQVHQLPEDSLIRSVQQDVKAERAKNLKLVRQSQIVQNAMYSHMYDAVSDTYITPAVPFTLSQLGILTMRHILAVFMFDVRIFIHSPRVTYYPKSVFYVDF